MENQDLNKRKAPRKATLIVLLILNIMVLMGQIAPEAAPPFARIVSIVFLVLNLAFVAHFFLKPKEDTKNG